MTGTGFSRFNHDQPDIHKLPRTRVLYIPQQKEFEFSFLNHLSKNFVSSLVFLCVPSGYSSSPPSVVKSVF